MFTTPVVPACRTHEFALTFAQLNIATTVGFDDDTCGSFGADGTTSMSSMLTQPRPLDDANVIVTVSFAATAMRGSVYLMYEPVVRFAGSVIVCTGPLPLRIENVPPVPPGNAAIHAEK